MGSIVKRLFHLGILGCLAAPAFAEQSAGPWTNLPVCTSPGGRTGVKIVSDGRGGAVMAWYDQRHQATPSKMDVYIQAINAGGITKWTPDGVPLCTAPEDQYNVALASDGDGGAIAAWTDLRDPLGYIYAQRVDRRGRSMWTPDGINVAPSQPGANARVEPDGFGGAFVAWENVGRYGRGIYAQRLDSEGRLLWGPAGIGICTVPGFHFAPNVVSDGVGGAIISWSDMRQPSARIYAQRVNGTGVPVWTPNGIPVCSFAADQRGGAAVSDGVGGAIMVWRDSRISGPGGLGLFAQRVDGLGNRLWDQSGVGLCNRPLIDDLFVVGCANRGGAIFAWHDRRSGQYDIRAQSVSASGTMLWDAEGSAVCIAPGDQTYPAIASDEAGGAFVTWMDFRDSSGGVYVQHVRDAGTASWGASGVPTSTAAGHAYPAIAGDGRSGAIVAWTNGQSGLLNHDVLAERISDTGREGWREAGRREGPRSGREAVSEPEGDGLRFRLNFAVSSNMRIGVYDLAGRRVRNAGSGHVEVGEHFVRWDGRDEEGRRLRAGVYFVRIQTDQGEQTLRAVLGK